MVLCGLAAMLACPGGQMLACQHWGAEGGVGAAGYSGHHGCCWQSRRRLLAPVAPKGGDLVVLIVQTTLGGAPHGQMGACGQRGVQGVGAPTPSVATMGVTSKVAAAVWLQW